MTVRRIAVLLLLLPACLGLRPALAFDIAAAERGVVRVVSEAPDGTSTGTGFVVTGAGIVVTNWHVVTGGERVAVLTTGSSKVYPAEVLWQSSDVDLAVLRAPGLNATPVKLAGSDIHKAIKVYAIGYPGLADRLGDATDPTVTDGILSRLFQGSWMGTATMTILQHSAAINPGNSGGPLFDGCGRVIGVNTQGSGAGRIVRDEYGDVSDVMAGAGIYYASHIQTAVTVLRRLGHQPMVDNAPCQDAAAARDEQAIKEAQAAQQAAATAGAAAQEVARQVADVAEKANQAGIAADGARTQAEAAQTQAASNAAMMQQMLIWFVGLSGVTGLTLILALRRPRQVVVGQIEQISRRVAGAVGRPAAPSRRSAPSGAALLHLVGCDGEGQPLRFAVPRGGRDAAGLVLGRERGSADLVVKDTGVSRRHARLSSDGVRVYLEDLGSTNGTQVNGRRIAPHTPQPLQAGDRVRVGRVELQATD